MTREDRGIKGREDIIHSAAGQIETEAKMLMEAVDARGIDIDEDYADKVIRSELEELGELVETMSEAVGQGQAISVTKPSDLRKNRN